MAVQSRVATASMMGWMMRLGQFGDCALFNFAKNVSEIKDNVLLLKPNYVTKWYLARICYALFMEYPFHEMKPFGFMDWAEMEFPESMRPVHGLGKKWAVLWNSITFRGTKSEQHSVPWNKERVPRNGLFIGMPYSWTAQSMERRSRSCAVHKPPPPPPHSSSSSERRVGKRQKPNYAPPRLQ